MSPTSGVIGEAWGLYKRHWQHLLTFSFLVYVGVALISALLGAIFSIWLAALLGAVVSIFALFWLQAALVKAVDDVRDGRADLALGETFDQARAQLPSVVVAGLLAALGIVVGLILFIVPGLVLLTWWCVIIPVVVLENKSAGDAFGRSRELVRGYGWSVFGVIVLVVLLLIGFNIVLSAVLALLVNDWLRSFLSQFISGTLTAPFTATVLTLLYFRLRAAKETPAPPPPPPPPTAA